MIKLSIAVIAILVCLYNPAPSSTCVDCDKQTNYALTTGP